MDLSKIKAMAEQLVSAIEACEGKADMEETDNAPEPKEESSGDDEMALKSFKMKMKAYK